MLYYVVKLLISAILIVVISEVAKRSSLLGGLIASLPVVSLLAIIWLWIDEKDAQKVIQLSNNIVFLVIPSLSFFIALAILMKRKITFWAALPLSLFVMALFYLVMVLVLNKLGFNNTA